MAIAIGCAVWASNARADVGPTAVSSEIGPEQIFQGEFSPTRSTAAFSRDTQPVGLLDANELERAGTSELHGSGLEDTIRAFGVAKAEHVAPQSGTLLAFWKDDDQATDAGPGSAALTPESAKAGETVGAGNVLIPLPTAALSGLSLMGGVSIVAWVKRLCRR